MSPEVGPSSGSTRRSFMITPTVAAVSSTVAQKLAHAAIVRTDPERLPPIPLPAGIRSRYVSNINELTFHVLEAGFEDKSRPCVLLLHGFPELAYAWRKVMLPLASAGFHVPPSVSAAKAGFSTASAYRMEQDLRLPRRDCRAAQRTQ